MTARQFAFIISRMIAVILSWLLISNLPSLASSFALIGQHRESLFSEPDYSAWMFAVISLAVWSAVATAAIWFWKSAGRFAAHLLARAESEEPAEQAGKHLPWERSALAIFGVIVLVGSIPEALRLLALWVSWGKSAQ